jgi:hypothetical protein
LVINNILIFSKNKKEKMSTTASSVNPYIIPHTVTSPNASKSAMEAGAARTAHQHAIAEVGRGKVGGGGGNKKNKKSKKYRKSAMKKRFSKKFRRSILRKKARKLNSRKKNKKALLGGDKLTIPSFSQTSPGGTGIIKTLAGNHAQTISYSKFDGDVSKPASS